MTGADHEHLGDPCPRIRYSRRVERPRLALAYVSREGCPKSEVREVSVLGRKRKTQYTAFAALLAGWLQEASVMAVLMGLSRAADSRIIERAAERDLAWRKSNLSLRSARTRRFSASGR